MEKIKEFILSHPEFTQYETMIVSRFNTISKLYDEKYCNDILNDIFNDLILHGKIIW